ncbi:MAG: hypothetical protein ACP5I3_11665, partial [Thermoproteus sp.]
MNGQNNQVVPATGSGASKKPDNRTPRVYIYTQHQATIRIIQSTVPDAVVLKQDRSKRAYEDVMTQAPTGSTV